GRTRGSARARHARPSLRAGLRYTVGPPRDAPLGQRGGALVLSPQLLGCDGACRRPTSCNTGLGTLGGWSVLLRRWAWHAQGAQPRSKPQRRGTSGRRQRSGDRGGRGRGCRQSRSRSRRKALRRFHRRVRDGFQRCRRFLRRAPARGVRVVGRWPSYVHAMGVRLL
ncbi:MAG: hypothetical protein AVDCRST_MAG58-4196, partial [uncultured Rubrobacteraceae bacterium]